MPGLYVFAFPAALAAAGTLFGVKKLQGSEYVKSLFPLSLLAISLLGPMRGERALLTAGIALGLFFCVFADYFLGKINNSRVFMFGLAGFLLGYLVYGLTFSLNAAFTGPVFAWAGFLCLAGAVQFLTLRKLPREMRIPVVVYLSVVSFLLVGAGSFLLYADASLSRRLLVFLGAVFIYSSDSLIAHNLYRSPIKDSDLYLLPPYYAGQIMICLSLYVPQKTGNRFLHLKLVLL